MAELSTLARPYAEAVFRLAQEKNALGEWSGRLATLAAIVSDGQMQAVIADPNTLPRVEVGKANRVMDERK